MGVTSWEKLTQKPEIFTADKTILNSDSNWNSISEIGCYKVQVSSWKDASSHNSPNGFLNSVSPYGLLMVLGSDGKSDAEKRRVQIYYPYSTVSKNTVPLCRCYNNGTWNNWHYLSSPDMYKLSILYGGGSTGNFGSITIDGQKNNWAGLYFNSASRYFLVNKDCQGSFTTENTWQWRFNNGVLDVGSVPWEKVINVPTATASNNGLMTSAMVEKLNTVQKVVVQSTEPSSKCVNDIWIQVI